MIAPRTSALALATALLVAACGGGDDKGATTTSSSIEDTTSTFQPTTTTIDPALRELLLVAEDLKGFKEQTPTEPADPEGSNAPLCGDPAISPAGRALDEEPFVDGATFVRGADDAVEVSSTVVATTPEKAEAALKEALDPKAVECLEGDFRTLVEKDLPAGTTLEFKTTSTESTVAGTDQAILVSSTVTVKGAAASATLRMDFVFLRKAGVILSIHYFGPSNLATSAERQRIVAIAAKKLAGDSGTSTTSAAGGPTSSSRGSTSSTRRSSSTTRQGGSTSSSNRSTTSTTR